MRDSLQLLYDITVAATVSVEADSVEDACRLAIEEADNTEAWKTTDHASDPYVFEILESERSDPAAEDCTPVQVPDIYTRDGPPPTITFIGDQPPGATAVEHGTVRIRFHHPSFALSSELSDTPPPPGNKPLVTVTRRHDGTPEISVIGGTAHVRVCGWDLPDEQARSV